MAGRFSPSAFGSRIDGLIADLAQTPADTHRWMLLWHHAGHARLEPEAARRLDTVLARLDLDVSFQRDSTILTPVMDSSGSQRIRSGPHRSRINRWADGIDSGAYPTPAFVEEFGTEARDAFIERLIHWMHGLATRHPEDPDTEFARLLDGLARVPAPLLRTCATH